jgi:hypothetical protein
MIDFVTKFPLGPETTIPVERIKEHAGFIRHLFAVALIPLGGVLTVTWIAFLCWMTAKTLNLW